MSLKQPQIEERKQLSQQAKVIQVAKRGLYESLRTGALTIEQYRERADALTRSLQGIVKRIPVSTSKARLLRELTQVGAAMEAISQAFEIGTISKPKYKLAMAELHLKNSELKRAFRAYKRLNPEPLDQGAVAIGRP